MAIKPGGSSTPAVTSAARAVQGIRSAARVRRMAWLATFAVALGAMEGASAADPPSNVSVFASGLNNPRGIKFGPDGDLYVAEGGTGGPLTTTAADCAQVVPPIGPYSGSPVGARISRIDARGQRRTVIDNLPSSQTSAGSGSLVSGVGDIAFIGRTLYAVMAGAGCSHGLADTVNGIIRVNRDGTFDSVADLSAFQQANPVAHPEPGDFEPDGTWYSMVTLHGDLYALEPNHGELVRVSTNGKIARVIDLSATLGHVVPSALTLFRGTFYVGNLGTFPIVDGTQKVWAVTPGGAVYEVASGFTTVLGIAFDRQGRMYVLENTTGNPFPTPGTGRIVRVGTNNQLTVIASGLALPTAMTFGPGDDLYVTDLGFGPPPVGLGSVLRVEIDN